MTPDPRREPEEEEKSIFLLPEKGEETDKEINLWHLPVFATQWPVGAFSFQTRL
jgi:hypothetical protein